MSRKDYRDVVHFIKKVFSYNRPIDLFLAGMMAVFKMIASLVPAYLTMQILDVAIPESNLKKIVILASGVLLFTVFESIANTILAYLYMRISKVILIKYQNACVKKLFSLSGDYYSRMEVGEVLTTLSEDVEQVRGIISSVLFRFISDCLTALCTAALLFQLHKGLSVILLCILPVVVLTQSHFQKLMQKNYADIRETQAMRMSALENIVSNIKSCVLIKSEKFFGKRYAESTSKFANQEITVNLLSSINSGILDLLVALVVVLILGVGGYQVVRGAITLGGLIVFDRYVRRLFLPVMQMSSVFMNLQMMLVSIRKIDVFLSEQVGVSLSESVFKEETPIGGDLVVKNLSFSYTDERPVICNMTTRFRRNEVTAIVGESGCGKSTLISLLFRLWDQTEGEILFGGIDIRKYDLTYLRDNINIISQDVYLFNDTLYNNIMLDSKNISEREFWDVIDDACLSDLLDRLPEREKTVVGERGIKLSGGEKQRISIARALLHSSAPVLILDEATSALDQITEKNIITNIVNKHAKGKIVILITHRLAAITDVDQIIVFGKGQVVEEGKHLELMEHCGYYHALYQKGTSVEQGIKV